MNEFVHFSFLATVVQAAGAVLAAGLMLPLSRSLPGQFLRYWSVAWLCLAIALFTLFLAHRVPGGRTPFLVAYCFAEYLFAFLLWAGCREAARGTPLTPRDGWLLAPFAVAAVFGPVGLYPYAGMRSLYPFHAAVLATLFLAAIWATRGFPAGPLIPATGRWVLRTALALLSVLFLHYAVVAGYLALNGSAEVLDYLAFASLYDTLFETVLAFGMVLTAADRMRAALEEKNRQLAALTAELETAARTDPLTGLYNRRGLDRLRAAASPAAPLTGSLAVLDLNDLKVLNDRFGHPAGDASLQLVARALRGQVRVTDSLFRTGGDEFAVVMPGCPPAELAARLGRLDALLSDQRLPGADRPVGLTVSWGVAEFTSAADLDAAYDRADQAMYVQKRRRKAAREPVAVG